MNNGSGCGGVLVTAVQPWNPAATGSQFAGQQQQQVPLSPNGVVGCGNRWMSTGSPAISPITSGGGGNRVVMTTAFQNGLQAAITAGGLIAASPAVPPTAFIPQVRTRMCVLLHFIHSFSLRGEHWRDSSASLRHGHGSPPLIATACMKTYNDPDTGSMPGLEKSLLYPE